MRSIFHKVLNSNKMEWRRKDLRKNSTKYEDLLWQELRNNKLGYKFKRQYSIVNFVIDFYCAKVKLAIEIDGPIHKTKSSIDYDRHRTQYINSLGIKEIRFSNYQINMNMPFVINKIIESLPSPEVRRGTEGEVI